MYLFLFGVGNFFVRSLHRVAVELMVIRTLIG